MAGHPAPPFVAFMLSSAGYAALQLSKRPSDGGAFDQGMLARRTILNDPAPAALEEPYRQRIDAMILIGGNPDSRRSWGSTEVRTAEKAIRQLMGRRARVVAAETGRAIFRDNGTDESGIHKIEGIEHFGYVDGRSQPLMLKELVRREADESDGISVWNPEFPIGQVLVPDPGSPHRGTAFGSYFVFRKLEQNVAAFKKRIEEELADETGLGELAGAMLVGRFEDGTPVVSQRDPGGDNPVMNNFDYAADPDGLRCPLHAHIRKTNPRGDVRRQFGLPNDHEERSHIMARRGMTYGRRNRVTDPSNEPPGGVGLMFMAYHRDLATGFEFTQQSWANAAGFAAAGTGRDPIIGQRGTAAAVPLQIPGKWGVRDTPTTPVTFEEFVSHPRRRVFLRARQEHAGGDAGITIDRIGTDLSQSTQVHYILTFRYTGAIPIRPPTMRRPNQAPPMNGPRFNEWIQSPKVRVIDHEGENLGVMYTREAMAAAQELGLDLVEVSPNADPPVAKYLDVGKFKYEAQKKANLARKSQKTQEIKEIKMRPNIDDHDYDTKMKKVHEFIGEGDKVKVTLRFRGRELSHGQLGMAVLQRVAQDTTEVAKVEAYPRMEGRQMLMVLSPK